MPRIVTAKEDQDQFSFVDNEKLRLRLVKQADRMDEMARAVVYETYNNAELLTFYHNIRESGVFEKGGESKIHRKVLEFPSFEVYDFCKAVFEPEYGINWYKEKKLWRHELIKPWMVVKTY